MSVLVKPLDLILTARKLSKSSGSKRPRQTDLKRAISTAYYALFHRLCQNCADCLIGSKGSDRSEPAWLQAYRAVDHGYAKGQCKNRAIVSKFPKDIEDFANLFHDLQIQRHAADYDPASRFSRTDVETWINAAEAAIRAFNKAPIKDRRAFAAWTGMKERKN